MSNITDTTRTAAAAGATLAGGEAVAQTMPKLGPLSTASPGPGDFSGGAVDFTRLGIKGQENFSNFGCTVFKENPNTPDWTTANAYFERDVHNVDIKMPDGNEIRCWAFGDPIREPGRAIFPSPLIRVQEGDLVHVKLEASKGSHTIHHHGIEPTTMNDGVGHVSMEVTGSYIYQYQTRSAGTYFYHCHKNTVTHFEMGLYGLMIVDMDPRWHEITNTDHDVGLCGDDANLHIFEPKYFLITGTPTRPNVATDAQKVVAAPGKKILIRLLNASYSVLQVKIHGLEAKVISVDGHSLNKPWNSWMTIAPGKAFQMPTAQRYDLYIDTTSPANIGKTGTFKVEFEFQHWVTRQVHNLGHPLYEGRSFTTITI
jgi:plastocyanin